MAELLCQALFVNFSNTFTLLRNTILQFTPDQWLRDGWWQLEPAEQPIPQVLIQYLEEIEERANLISFHKPTDENLSHSVDQARQHGDTQLEHFTYALRQTCTTMVRLLCSRCNSLTRKGSGYSSS